MSSMAATKLQDFSITYIGHQCELRRIQKTTQTDRALLWFKSIFFISQRNYCSILYFRTKGAIEMEITRQKSSKHWYIFHPFSLPTLIWEVLIIVIMVFCLVFTPFKCSFLNCFMARYYLHVGRTVQNIYNAAFIEVILTVILLFDIVGSFLTGIYNYNSGEAILDPNEIIMRYCYPNFIIDLSTSFPIDFIIIHFYGMNTYGNLKPREMILLQLYSFYKLLRFRKLFIKWYRLSTINSSWTQGFQLVSAFIIFYVIFSWSICLDLVIPELLLWDNLYEDENAQSWIVSSGFLQMGLLNQYGLSIVNAFHSFLGVDTEWHSLYSAEDYIINIIKMVTCKIYELYFLILILITIASSNALQVKIHLVRNHLEAYMKYKDYPKHIKKRLNRFYLYRFQARYLSNKAILKLLTKSLRDEISMCTCQKNLQQSDVFQSVPENILLRFTQQMTKEMFFPKDVIIQGNTYGECMYFICSGTVVVSTVSGKEICTLKGGDFFGEIALISQDKRRVATVKAVVMTEVYKLEFAEYKKLTNLYPDVYAKLEKHAMERYRVIYAADERFDLSKKYGVD